MAAKKLAKKTAARPKTKSVKGGAPKELKKPVKRIAKKKAAKKA